MVGLVTEMPNPRNLRRLTEDVRRLRPRCVVPTAGCVAPPVRDTVVFCLVHWGPVRETVWVPAMVRVNRSAPR